MRSIAKPGHGLRQAGEDRGGAAEGQALVALSAWSRRSRRRRCGPAGRCGLRSSRPIDRLDDEVVGAGVPVHALLAGAPERGAHPVDEDDVRDLGHSASKIVGCSSSLGARSAARNRLTVPTKRVSGASTASWHGFDKGIGDHLCGCVNLPGPRAELGERVADGLPRSTGSGGVQATRRSSSGVSRFSTGMFSSLGARLDDAARAALSRASASGLRSAQARGGGRRRRRRARSGGRSVAGAAGLDRGPPAVELGAARAAGELLQRGEFALGLRAARAPRRRATRRARAGRARCRSRGRSRRGPSTARGRRRGCARPRTVCSPRQPPPRLRARRLRLAVEHRGELLLRRSRSCRCVEQLAASASRRSTSSSTSSAAYSSQDCGQRPGRPVGGGVLLGEVDAEQCPRRRRRARRAACPSSRAPSSVSKIARGVEADLAQAGRSWLAACSIHSSSPMASLQRGEVADRRRIEEEDAGAAPEDLDQVGALRVAEAGGALGVDRDRAVAGGELDASTAAGRGLAARRRCTERSSATRRPCACRSIGDRPPSAGGSPASMQTSSPSLRRAARVGVRAATRMPAARSARRRPGRRARRTRSRGSWSRCRMRRGTARRARRARRRATTTRHRRGTGRRRCRSRAAPGRSRRCGTGRPRRPARRGRTAG